MTAAVTLASMGNGPAFSAYVANSFNIANNTATKITFNTEVFDTNNCFDPTTNYRFTPTVAGYYQVNGVIVNQGFGARNYVFQTLLYKNGSTLTRTSSSISLGTGADFSVAVNTVVYMNGSTDYLELYGYHYDYTSSGSDTIAGGSTYSAFSAAMIRGA